MTSSPEPQRPKDPGLTCPNCFIGLQFEKDSLIPGLLQYGCPKCGHLVHLDPPRDSA